MQERDDDQQRCQGEKGQVFRPGPTLIAVGQCFATGLGARLCRGERATQHNAGQQSEEQIVHHQRVPAEGFGVEDSATDHQRQA